MLTMANLPSKPKQSKIPKKPSRVFLPDEEAYDPLTYNNLGRSISETLLRRPPIAMDNLPLFNGAGIYAIYYTGEHKLYRAYAPLASMHQAAPFNRPIYVGKAEAAGARKGKRDLEASGSKLADRLTQHANSIIAAQTSLNIADFYCRYLIVNYVWIPLGETIVINLTDPLWNVVVEGFGNHTPGKGRREGMRPMWDTVHPGRKWADKLPNREETALDIDQRIAKFFAGDQSVRLPEPVQITEATSDAMGENIDSSELSS
jgi:Eco29kI restriction endonuclease